MKKALLIIMLLALAVSLFSVPAFAEAADAPEAAEESSGPDALDMFIYIAGGAVVVLALAMILIAYIKNKKG